MISETILKSLPTFKASTDEIAEGGRYVYQEDDFMPFTKIDDTASFFAIEDILTGVGLDKSSQLGLVCHTLESPSRLHYHDYLEVCFIFKGRLIHIIDKEPVVMTAGDISIIPENTKHLVAPLEDAKPLIVDFLIHPNLLKTILYLDELEDFLTKPENFSTISITQQALQNFFNTYNHNHQQANLSVLGSFFQFLYQLNLQKSRVSAHALDSLTQECLNLIKANPAQISQKEIAHTLNYSASYLSRHIKKTTGKTISQLITDEKLHLAQDLLANSNHSISDIAEQVGYASESHFFRTFKDHYQITPNHYRQLMTR